jgi:hypothetical protein
MLIWIFFLVLVSGTRSQMLSPNLSVTLLLIWRIFLPFIETPEVLQPSEQSCITGKLHDRRNAFLRLDVSSKAIAEHDSPIISLLGIN